LLSALVPLALLLLPLLFFAWFMRGAASKVVQPNLDVAQRQAPVQLPVVETPARPVPTQPRVTETPPIRVADTSRPETVASAPLQPTTVNLSEFRLSDGVTLKVPASSFLSEIYKYLSDAAAPKDRAFVFDGLDFDDATIRVRPETETAITSLGSLLRAFSSVNLRIEGHTDPSGDAAADQKRSLARADAVKDLLVKAGVPSNRITTIGFGSEKPVASNETTEGRAKNRRIELSLTKA
jgi:outer membrane protein OmpA-like peptidoglycan-associated protein